MNNQVRTNYSKCGHLKEQKTFFKWILNFHSVCHMMVAHNTRIPNFILIFKFGTQVYILKLPALLPHLWYVSISVPQDCISNYSCKKSSHNQNANPENYRRLERKTQNYVTEYTCQETALQKKSVRWLTFNFTFWKSSTLICGTLWMI